MIKNSKDMQEALDRYNKELDESGLLAKIPERPEEREYRATKGGMSIGVIFTRGRQQEDKEKE